MENLFFFIKLFKHRMIIKSKKSLKLMSDFAKFYFFFIESGN